MRHPLLRKYGKLIDFIGQVLGEDYELALFDLKSEGYPLIMVAGGLNSGRPLGTPLAAHRRIISSLAPDSAGAPGPGEISTPS